MRDALPPPPPVDLAHLREGVLFPAVNDKSHASHALRFEKYVVKTEEKGPAA